MDGSDDEKPIKRPRLDNYDKDLINKPSTSSSNPCPSHNIVDQMDPSILKMRVEELVFLLIKDPNGTFSCPKKMGKFYNNFLNLILSMFKKKYLAYVEKIDYIQSKINNSHLDFEGNIDIENFGDHIIDQYEAIVINELVFLDRQSDDKKRDTYQSVLRGIDNKLTKLINLKNNVLEKLTDVEPLPSFSEDDSSSYVADVHDLDEDSEEDSFYPVLISIPPIILIEADTMANIFNDSTIRRLVEMSTEEHITFQNPAAIPNNSNVVYPVLPVPHIEEQENEFVSDYCNIFEELQSRVSCLKVWNNMCLIGCVDGVLKLGNLESNTIFDSFQAHTLPISAITTWQGRIFTTSVDKSIRCFHMKTQFVKKLVLPDPLTCADHDGDGVLYTGTSRGHIYQLNMLALTIRTPFVQVGTEQIDNLIILKADHPVIRKMIVSMDYVVTLRDCSSGDILLTLRFDKTSLFDYSPLSNKVFAVSPDSIYKANTLENESRVVSLLPFPTGGTSILYIDGNLLVSDNDGNTLLFNEDLTLLRVIKGVQHDIITCMAPWKNFIISYFSESGCMGKALLRGNLQEGET